MNPPAGQHNNGPLSPLHSAHTSLSKLVLSLAFSKSVGLSSRWTSYQVLISRQVPGARLSLRYLRSQVKFLSPIILMKTFSKILCPLIVDGMSDGDVDGCSHKARTQLSEII